MAYDGSIKFDTQLDVSGVQKGADQMGSIVKGMAVFSLLQKGLDAIVGSVDAAISRYDTLNKFPQVMEKMGYSTDVAETSMKKLSDGIQGLPTTLDSIVGSTQRLAVATGGLDKGTDTALALNNALLASGASSEAASRGTEQYIQALSRGKIEGEEWKTLMEIMPYAVQKVAEAFGFVGTGGVVQLQAALSSGEVTMTQFNDKIIELNGGVGGFAEVAKTSTGGIGTAWTNLQTAIVKGTTGIIQSIDTGLSKTRFQSIENIINQMKNGITKALDIVAKAFGFLAENIVPVTAGVVTFFAAWKTAQLISYASQLGSVTKAISAMTPAILKTVAAKVADGAQTLALHALYIKDAIAKAASAVKNYALAASLAAAMAAENGHTGALIANTVAAKLAAAATWVLNAAMNANPVFLLITAVAAITAGVIALVAWLSKSSAAYNEEKEAIKEASEAHEEYVDKLAEDKKAAADNIAAKQGESAANKQVAASLNALTDGYGKVTGDMNAARQAVDSLNSTYGDLGLVLDETTGSLNMTTEELNAYIDAQSSVSDFTAKEEEYNRLLQEKSTLQAQINNQRAKEEQYAKMLDEGTITQSQYNKLMKESGKLIEDYEETFGNLSIEVDAAYGVMMDAHDAEAKVLVKETEIRNNQMRDVKQYARQYNLSADEIITAAAKLEGGLEEWATKQAALFTESGMNLDMVARKWDMTEAEVEGYMAEWGMSLDEFNTHMEEAHTKEGLSLEELAAKWGTTTDAITEQMANSGITMQEWSDNQQEAWDTLQEAISTHSDSIINSFKEIPKEYEMSAQEMIDTLRTNRERYAEWQQAMSEISEQVSAETLAELQKLGPGALSAINEMRENGGEGLREFDELIRGTISDSTSYAISELNNPELTAAAGNMPTSMGEAVSSNPALTNAATTMITTAKDELNNQVGVVDFSTIGQTIAKDIVRGVSTANMSGIANGVANAIRNGTGTVTSAATSMSTSVQNVVRTMSTQMQSIMTQMMSQLNSTVIARTGAIRASITSMGNGIVTALNTLKTQAVNIATQMMTSINSAIVSRAGTIRASISSMGTGITTALNTAKTQAVNIATQMMTSINSAVVTRTGTLRSSATAAANAVVTALRDMQTKGPQTAQQMMADTNTAIITRTATVKNSATAVANGIVSALETMIAGGKTAANNLMDGIHTAMSNKAQSLYNKAKEIADNIARTLRNAWDEHSPSRVSYKIMEFFMRAMYNAMGDMSGLLYRKADGVADGLTDRMTLSPDALGSMYDRLRSIVAANPLGGTTLIPQVAGAGAAGGSATYFTFEQTINSPKHTSPSENSREAQDMLRRFKHQIP